MLTPQVVQVAHSLGLTSEAVRACASAADVARLRESVKKAWRAKALTTHPDRGGDVEEFKRLSAAYSQIEKYLELLDTKPTAPRLKITFTNQVAKVSVIHFSNDWWNRAGT